MTIESLAGQQNALLHALRLPLEEDAAGELLAHGTLETTASWRRGLAAYRTHANALAARALSAAFPIVAQLVGEANFDALARRLWVQGPPARGDIAQWGVAFPAFLETLTELHVDAPYLADVARVEWLLHLAATAADGNADMQSLQLLRDRDASVIRLLVAPGTACLVSAYPVASIINAHLSGTPSMAQVSERMQDRVAETAVVWREGFRARVREAVAGEADFLACSKEMRSLGDSLDAAAALDFNSWLVAAAHSGLVLGAANL